MFGKFLVHAWSWCGSLKGGHNISVIEDQTKFGMLKGAKTYLR